MNTTIEDVKQYFDQFGKVSDVLERVKAVVVSDCCQNVITNQQNPK